MLQQHISILIVALLMTKLLLFDFSAKEDWSGWKIQNDVVMGGNSSSALEKSTEGHAIFKGSVSLENNGGFASVQYRFDTKNIEGYKKALILLKGDGKNYQFRMKSSLDEKASYIHTFKTSGNWETIEISLKEMEPFFRGNKLDIPNFPAETVEEVRFLIGNKKAEDFRLEIKKIELE